MVAACQGSPVVEGEGRHEERANRCRGNLCVIPHLSCPDPELGLTMVCRHDPLLRCVRLC